MSVIKHISITICDIDRVYTEKAKDTIEKFADKHKVKTSIVQYDTGETLSNVWLSPHKWTDILILEMDLDDIYSMDIASQLRKKGYKGEIIFYTKDKAKVFDSFFVDTFHYVLKDATDLKTCEEIFLRTLDTIEEKEADYMTFDLAGEYVTVKLNDIKYITVDWRLCKLHYEDDKTFEFYSSLDKLNAKLATKGFIRISRFTIVNYLHIKKRTATEIEMDDGNVFTIGRTYKKEVKELLDENKVGK